MDKVALEEIVEGAAWVGMAAMALHLDDLEIRLITMGPCLTCILIHWAETAVQASL